MTIVKIPNIECIRKEIKNINEYGRLVNVDVFLK